MPGQGAMGGQGGGFFVPLNRNHGMIGQGGAQQMQRRPQQATKGTMGAGPAPAGQGQYASAGMPQSAPMQVGGQAMEGQQQGASYGGGSPYGASPGGYAGQSAPPSYGGSYAPAQQAGAMQSLSMAPMQQMHQFSGQPPMSAMASMGRLMGGPRR